MEVWKDIEGYEGHYQVSNIGNVRNTKTGKLLTGDKNTVGYKRVILYTPIKKRFFIHRLVAYHFVDGYNKSLIVNHKDGNKANNRFDNLEWVTRSENDLHAFRLGLRKAHKCTFRNEIEQYDIKTGEVVQVYKNAQDCCERFGVTRGVIYNTCNGKQKSCKGFGLRYKSKVS